MHRRLHMISSKHLVDSKPLGQFDPFIELRADQLFQNNLR